MGIVIFVVYKITGGTHHLTEEERAEVERSGKAYLIYTYYNRYTEGIMGHDKLQFLEKSLGDRWWVWAENMKAKYGGEWWKLVKKEDFSQ